MSKKSSCITYRSRSEEDSGVLWFEASAGRCIFQASFPSANLSLDFKLKDSSGGYPSVLRTFQLCLADAC
jgi:hypothetical protein